jgi:hypothetical protein
MLQIKFSRNEPGTVPLEELMPGKLFKMQRGTTPYMVAYLHERMQVRGSAKDGIVVISLTSGNLHIFCKSHPVVELDGKLELTRVK